MRLEKSIWTKVRATQHKINREGAYLQDLSVLEESWKNCLTWFCMVGRNAHTAGSNPQQTTHTQYRTIIAKMNKAELVQAVQKALGKDTSKATAERSVEAVIDSIKGGLKKGKSVQLVGFGTFKVVQRKARIGINPKTGAKIKIKASKGVKFGAGKDLKSKL
jgi:nucleoid DNA-binding protein